MRRGGTILAHPLAGRSRRISPWWICGSGMLLTAALQLPPHPAAAESVQACPPSPSPSLEAQQIPADVCSPPPGTPPQLPAFGTLAWQTFKMLVWPASQDQRGVPNTAVTLTDMTGPRVFETYKADWETLQPNYAKPSPGNSHAVVANPCANNVSLGPQDIVLASFSKFDNLQEAGDSRFGNLLVAQNSTYVRYQIAYGPTEFDLILRNGLYDPRNLPPGRVPDGTAVPKATDAPDGAITVKSAWVEMSPTLANASHFYRRTAWLQDPLDQTCRQAQVGLVGLHLVRKTPSRPQWVWASFEQTDNVPDPDQPADSKGYTFNNGNPNQPMQPLPAGSPYLQSPTAQLPPYNVQRLQPIADEILALNRAWQGALAAQGSVWRYYKLVLVEWPELMDNPTRDGLTSLPSPPCLLAPNANLANTVMETFLQGAKSCNVPVTTCMGCHNGARGIDFVWSLLLNPNKAPATGQVHPVRNAAMSFLRPVMGTKE